MRFDIKFSVPAKLATLVLLTATTTFGQSASGKPELKYVVEVPLLECDGLPCVEARIGDGAPIKLGIDTGDVDSVLDGPIAQAAGLEPTAAMPSGAPAGVYPTLIPSVKIGSLTLTKLPAVAMSLAEMRSKNQIPHVSGTLAYTAFRDRVVQLDFATHVMRVSEELLTPRECLSACSKMSLITFGKKGPAIVVAEGFEVNGKRVTAQVDTMYSGSLLVYTASIEKLGLGDAANVKETRQFPYTDGGVTMKAAPVERETFHGVALGPLKPVVYFPTPGVHEPDALFDATVGLEIFRGAALTMNFHDMTIEVEKR